MTVKELIDQIEMFIGQAGVSSVGTVSKAWIIKCMNNRLAELYNDTGWVSDDLTITSIADQIEYVLPNSGIPVEPWFINKVFVDGIRASKMSWKDLENLKRLAGEDA